MNLIEMRDIRLRFTPEAEVLKGINLDIRQGEILTLIGESGCGKSSLTRVLLGLQTPTSGTVSYFGEPLTPSFKWTPERRLRSALIHQDSYASLNPHHSVGAILMAPLKKHRPKIDARKAALEALASVELKPAETFFKSYSHQLSGGQRQRVSIARALLLNPDLVVADEPVSGLDASVKVEILDLLRKLNEEKGTAFVYVTHDLATASRLPKSRLAVLYLGEVVEVGPLPSLLQAPRHPYLQALLSAVIPPDPRQARAYLKLSEKLLSRATLPANYTGCSFEPRCDQAFEPCRQQNPELRRQEGVGEWAVACHACSSSPKE